MSAVNWELIKDALIPGGPLLTLAGKGWFDKYARRKTTSETVKIDADSAKVITEVALTLLIPLKEEIAELRGRVETLEGERDSYAGKLRRALAYIRELRLLFELRNPGEEPPALPLDIQI